MLSAQLSVPKLVNPGENKMGRAVLAMVARWTGSPGEQGRKACCDPHSAFQEPGGPRLIGLGAMRELTFSTVERMAMDQAWSET